MAEEQTLVFLELASQVEQHSAELKLFTRACPTEQNTIIIYKTYTPQRATYCKTYYQEHKAKILERKKQQYNDNYDNIQKQP